MRSNPIAEAFEDDPDWQLIDHGGDQDEYKSSDDPSQCKCGNWWTAKVADATFAKHPTQQDIQTLMKTVPAPTDANRPKCSGDCFSVKVKSGESWYMFKNKKTGQFGLTCTKQALWHCERVQP